MSIAAQKHHNCPTCTCTDPLPAALEPTAPPDVAQAARVAELEELLNRDFSAILKGKPPVDPLGIFPKTDAAEYWRFQAIHGNMAATRMTKISERYCTEFTAYRRKAEKDADQASMREKALAVKLDAALRAIAEGGDNA